MYFLNAHAESAGLSCRNIPNDRPDLPAGNRPGLHQFLVPTNQNASQLQPDSAAFSGFCFNMQKLVTTPEYTWFGDNSGYAFRKCLHSAITTSASSSNWLGMVHSTARACDLFLHRRPNLNWFIHHIYLP